MSGSLGRPGWEQTNHIMSLGLFALTALVASLLPEHHAPRGVSLDRNLFKLNHIPERALRGDWETPQVLLMTYERAWRDALAQVLRASGDTDAWVLMVVPESENLETVKEWLHSQDLEERVGELVVAPLDSAWIRDYGPLQTTDQRGQPIWLDASYPARPADDELPQVLAERLSLTIEPLPEQWDGGAVISNGAGLCATTEEAFDGVGISRGATAALTIMMEQMGCQVLALLPALSDDPTKHADMFAQFVAPDRVLLAQVDPRENPRDAKRMDQAARRLQRAARALNTPLRIQRVPLPVGEDISYFSYINGLNLGSIYLVPQYSDVAPLHEAAIYQAMSQAMPDKRLVPILADAIIPLHGALHCILLGIDLPEAKGSRPSATLSAGAPPPHGLLPPLVETTSREGHVKFARMRRSKFSRGKSSRTTTKIP